MTIQHTDLVDLKGYVPNMRLDIRYATTNNFVGEQLYPCARAYLISDAAKALRKASLELESQGLGIQVWDAYRPLSITRLFWDRTPPHLRTFLGNPDKGGSPHNRGCAIDMTLYDLSSGDTLVMPSEFDEFTERAMMSYMPPSTEVLHNRTLLQKIMESYGFMVRPDEWWHFDWHEYNKYPVLDLSLL